jgi:glycosyltransferase involved in cell wall biosynthesis
MSDVDRMSPGVAIVVRTKDRPDLLRRALASITSQSFDDWECVVVNDGGETSAVDDVVNELTEGQRARVRVLHQPTSRGRWVSANIGVLGTTAPLLVLHDDDDSWHPDFLARAVAYLEEAPERGGVVSRIEIIWESRVGEEFRTTRREMFQPQLSAPTLADTLLFNRFVPIAFVYRRRLHEELGLYDDSLPVVGDWAFNLKVLAAGPLEYLGDSPYAYWHQREGVEGTHGNSVIDSRGNHAKFDALIRDAALRQYVEANGLGLILYLTKFIDQRFVDVENGLRAEMRRANDFRLATRIRRRLSRSAGGLFKRPPKP